MSRVHETPELITKLRRAMCYDPNTGVLEWKSRPEEDFPSKHEQRRWNSRHANTVISTTNNKGYLIVGMDSVRHTVHRVIWAIYYGVWPQHQIDHINGKKDDNRIVNLKAATGAENQKNRPKQKNNTSGHTGIRKLRNLWQARLRDQHLGVFPSLGEAVVARNRAASASGFSSTHGIR